MGAARLQESGGWPGVLGRLAAGEDLPGELAAAALTEVLSGEATPAQVAAFITLIHAKGETIEELAALVATMRAFAEPLEVGGPIVDTCGTGASPQRKEACFNVSTIASLVSAGAGARIVKHGGRAATATSSSADLLAALGVAIDLPAGGIARCVDEAGIGFCFAPNFHPAMRHAAPVRRELGIPTVFNFIAPLSNPARPERQVVGVASAARAEPMARVLAENGAVRAMVVYGHDGLDELTTTTSSTVVELRDGSIRTYEIEPADVGIAHATFDQLRGGDVVRNVDLAGEVLSGVPGAHRDIVVLNSAAGLVVAGVVDELVDGVAAARESIDTGRAAHALDRFVKASQAASTGS